VYSGREAWQAANPDKSYGRAVAAALQERPGLHVSCLPFLRDHDASVLVWDMIDHSPIGYDVAWAVHSALFAYGVALVDNALLEPLARACVEEGAGSGDGLAEPETREASSLPRELQRGQAGAWSRQPEGSGLQPTTVDRGIARTPRLLSNLVLRCAC